MKKESKRFVQLTAGILFLSISTFAIGSCEKDDDDAVKSNSNKQVVSCDGSGATYNGDIKQIISSSCVGCHSNYSSYAGLKGIIDNGQFKRVVLTDQTMPQGAALTNAQLTKIQCWVDGGYKEN